MCEPVTIGTMAFTATEVALASASVAMTAISTGVSMMSQQANASAQMQAQENRYKAREEERAQTRQLAVDDAMAKADATNLKLAQNREAIGTEKQRAQIETLKQKSKAEVSSAENNALGGSMVALLGEFDRGESFFRQNLDTNELFFTQQAQAEKEAFGRQADNRVASVRSYVPTPVAQPNYLGGAIDAVGSSFNNLNSMFPTTINDQGNLVRKVA